MVKLEVRWLDRGSARPKPCESAFNRIFSLSGLLLWRVHIALGLEVAVWVIFFWCSLISFAFTSASMSPKWLLPVKDDTLISREVSKVTPVPHFWLEVHSYSRVAGKKLERLERSWKQTPVPLSHHRRRFGRCLQAWNQQAIYSKPYIGKLFCCMLY